MKIAINTNISKCNSPKKIKKIAKKMNYQKIQKFVSKFEREPQKDLLDFSLEESFGIYRIENRWIKARFVR